ncbi:MAG: 16S rRNA (cytosine(1402)-N(4))-methyltransferase RsmH [Clostridium sp.]|jgi:16S rRNA (cytosine1402-N4)-methyltransferase|nr:16S rRNA (cytosine(1402)-N(4))-methyltransferase RsmH [Clostridium sp.]
MDFQHHSVMLTEAVEQLRVKPEGLYLDGTAGGGGHAFQICRRLAGGHLYAMDQDEDAVRAAASRLAEFGEKVTLLRDNYSNARRRLEQFGAEKLDGILLDLGVSSYQLDEPSRGFSYRFDGELDMRMDQNGLLTAKEIVNRYPETELCRLIREYGEERFAGNIAKHIVAARQKKEMRTTFELNEAIRAAIPAKMRRDGHPSKRTFQALRIECNRELSVLKESLDDFIAMLNPGGRICVITFHSLEDRIVKTVFQKNQAPCTCPPKFPVCVCGRLSKGKVVTRKPILPSAEEQKENRRSRSAKLRVFERKSSSS